MRWDDTLWANVSGVVEKAFQKHIFLISDILLLLQWFCLKKKCLKVLKLFLPAADERPPQLLVNIQTLTDLCSGLGPCRKQEFSVLLVQWSSHRELPLLLLLPPGFAACQEKATSFVRQHPCWLFWQPRRLCDFWWWLWWQQSPEGSWPSAPGVALHLTGGTASLQSALMGAPQVSVAPACCVGLTG